MGTILISVNPFKWLDHIYTPQVADKYLAAEQPGKPTLFSLGFSHGYIETTGHFFYISSKALKGALYGGKAQAVIISGESGSGKTEATKKCLQFISYGCKGGETNELSCKLLAANPVLEAFGNAQTVRNNNSSRFGKWTELHLNSTGEVCQAKVVKLLLEKSRVYSRSEKERNFHVFYHMLATVKADKALQNTLKVANYFPQQWA